MLGLSGEEIKGVGKEGKDGAQGAFGAAGAAGEVENQGVAEAAQTPRPRAAKGVWRAPSWRMSSARPGTRRVETASVASGVMSRGARPVPPVVRTRAARLAAARRAGVSRSSSSGSVRVLDDLGAGVGEEAGDGGAGEVGLGAGKAAVADGDDDGGAASKDGVRTTYLKNRSGRAESGRR